ncbi:MAG: glycosyltransferase family 2 protein [Dehalococcoidia bacterium]
MNVSVVILTYNREELLCETIADVLGQTPAPGEIVVVDGSARHEAQTEAYLASVDGRVRYLRQSRPGMTAARNIGIEAAGGSIVLFVDDDVALPAGFVAAHAANYADPAVGAVGGRVHVSLDVTRPLGTPPPATGTDFDRLDRRIVAFGRGCNLSFRRSAIVEAGGFDETMTGHATAEEEDACFAVRRLGYRIVFDPAAWLIHRYQPSGGSRAEFRDHGDDLSYYRNKTYFALKNVAGLDFARVLWDTYRSNTLSARVRQAGPRRLFGRQILFWRGAAAGVAQFRRSGARRVALPYRHP